MDDYDEHAAKERGDVEGQLAVPDDHLPAPGEPYNRNQYVAWHGASAVYHTVGPTMPLPNGKMVDGKRKKIVVTSDNWMLQHAREASRFNQSLLLARNEILNGLYDIQTNHNQWSKITQPTHALWEIVDECYPNQQALLESTAVNGHLAPGKVTGLSRMNPVYTRNFRIHDLHLQSAPDSALSTPGLDIDERSFANISKSVLEELPPECMQSFREAQEKELGWRSQWLTESVDGRRAQFIPTTVWHA